MLMHAWGSVWSSGRPRVQTSTREDLNKNPTEQDCTIGKSTRSQRQRAQREGAVNERPTRISTRFLVDFNETYNERLDESTRYLNEPTMILDGLNEISTSVWMSLCTANNHQQDPCASTTKQVLWLELSCVRQQNATKQRIS